MKDRRCLRRYETEDYFPVVERGTDRIVGRLANLSAEGAMLITEEPVKKRDILKLTLRLPQPVLGHDSIDFDAECRWCRKGKNSDFYESGYLLKNVPVENQTTIMCLVLQLLSANVAENQIV